MNRFTFEPTSIPDVVRIGTRRFQDDRGFFCEQFRRSDFREAGILGPFVQDNRAGSTRGVVRGLHYQLPPSEQGKLVGPLRGRIFDVAVDLRAGAATFGRWVGLEMDAAEGDLLWIPPGFAHGYQTLSDEAEVFYKVTAEYDPEQERGIRWDDPELGIAWPLPHPILSQKDRGLPAFRAAALPPGPT